MALVKHETCQQYFDRRIVEGWKCISLVGYNAVLLSPDGIKKELDLNNDIETLRPSVGGDETTLNYFDGSSHPPDVLHNFEQVDETEGDGSSTFVANDDSESYYRDLYNLPASSGSGTINKITVYFSCYGEISGTFGKASIKSNSTITDGTEHALTTAFYTFSQEWELNPAPPGTNAWTWDDIDALQIGVALQATLAKTTWYSALCTQVYVEVDSSPAIDPPTVTTQEVDGIGTE